MLSKEEIISGLQDLILDRESFINENDKESIFVKDKKVLDSAITYINQLETDKQNVIEKLEERIKSVEKCYEDLIKPYYDEKLNLINTSLMSKREKEQFINKRNCLMVQKATLEEILEMLKGDKK